MGVKEMVFEFIETESQKQELEESLTLLEVQEGAQMPALQEAQRIYGYLPIEILERISCKLQIPVEELYSTATFYSQFSFVPKGKFTISVCMGTACYVKGAGDILDSYAQELNIKPGETTADRKFTLESCRCIGACGLAPVLTVNEEVYGRLTKKKGDKVLVTYQKMEDE
ncbi:NAD(P)H-dependent oxidoreductase subunit E [Enterococcus sp. PFB1-1]|uniref:NADH-quinone oxidoreductase subunit NuoE family protein n=1 Tax=unclassified Enterococcus TaxID=2608891 RepID=UPI00247630B3|nr:NAD(P)H-dependent oxidoreductase subunit E [Enterococcus sp. PFB1-1]MDH6364690.1 NADH:ubiquinone oxidoreductase subunit E [Enterococcus sp. PFB1-1]